MVRQVCGLSEDGETITLRRFHGGVQLEAAQQAPLFDRTLLVVDVETTGFDPSDDRIIELAVAKLTYCIQRRIITGHIGTWSWLEDPDRPIPPEISELTGITDQDVRGMKIPAEAAQLMASADLIVSHNAAFDWSFCVKRWPQVRGKRWACSLRQIDWSGHGFPVAKQELLARFHGFFYDGHRACIDVEALVRLLQLGPSEGAATYFQELLADMDMKYFHVRASGTPFEAKDELRARRYRWDAAGRVWWTIVAESQLAAEREWLDALYNRHRARGKPHIETIAPDRRWEYYAGK